MKNVIIALSILYLLGASSCNDDAIFEKELYKKVFALVSSDNYNIFQEIHPLTGDETVGYVSASCGGTSAPESTISITLEEDLEQFDTFNKAIYDADSERYARLLPRSKYTIDDYSIKIKAGERGGKTMIRVKADGLSPDSIYMVPLKVKEFSSYEQNEKKNTILYRVVLKNNYAEQSDDINQPWMGSNYSMTGVKNGTATLLAKQLQPLAWNRVRMIAGTEAYQPDQAIIDRASVILEVTHDNRVRILPYKEVWVKQINGDTEYPNEFKVIYDTLTKRTYNVFLLHYQYQVASGTVITMKEELRREVN